MRRTSRFLAALIAVSVLAGCASPSSKPKATTTTTVTTESVAATTPPAAVETTISGDAKKPISQILKTAAGVSTMAKLVEAAGMTTTLSGKRENTLFVPTDAAFEKLPDGWLAALQQPANKEKLRTLLRYHLLMGKVPVDQLVNIRTALTYQGGKLAIASNDGTITVNGVAKITQGDVPASNGYIQVVDTVLVPKGFKP